MKVVAAVPNGHAAPNERSAEVSAFDAIERQALALEAEAAPAIDAPGAAPGQAPIDNAAELLGALQLARLMVKPMFRWWPDFAETWSDPTLQAIADGGGQVMAKHGWTMGGLMSEFGPYIALGVATVPPVMVTLQAIKERREEQARTVPPAPVVATAPTDPPNQ